MKVLNKKFGREYESLEEYEAGIMLSGSEVKSIKDGRIKLDDAYVKIMEGEPYLVNAEVYRYQYTPALDYDGTRRRKLLLHKAELLKIKTKIRAGRGLTIVPISCYNKGSLIKIKIALVKGRKDVKKRKLEKAKEIKRSQQKEAKEYMKTRG